MDNIRPLINPCPPSDSVFCSYLYLLLYLKSEIFSLLVVVLQHVSLAWPSSSASAPLGAHISAILGFWSKYILITGTSHFHILALTCSPTVHAADLLVTNLFSGNV